MANVEEVYGPDISEALNYKAQTFATSYLENLGNGSFKVKNLPNEAQFSSVNTFLVEDFDSDGHTDLLLAGNLFPVEVETPRNDAGIGLYLSGDGKNDFTPVPVYQSGFYAPGDVKDMKFIKVGKGGESQKVILVASNNDRLQAIQWNSNLFDQKKEVRSGIGNNN